MPLPIDWLKFRSSIAAAISPQQVSALVTRPMTVEVQPVIAGIARSARPEELSDLTFEYLDHLQLSMYGASNDRRNIADHHLLVGSVLLECKVLEPERFVFEAADPLGLLLLSASDNPRCLPFPSLTKALTALQISNIGEYESRAIEVGIRAVTAMLSSIPVDKPVSESGRSPAEIRSAIEPLCESAGRRFWDWILASA